MMGLFWLTNQLVMLNLFQHLTCTVYNMAVKRPMKSRNKFGMTLIIGFIVTGRYPGPV